MRERTSNSVDALVFRKDPNNGGAYVTNDPRVAAELKELPKGLIITEPSTPASTAEDASRRAGRGPGNPEAIHQNGSHDPPSSVESVNSHDQPVPPNESLSPVHPSGTYQPQGSNPASPSDAVLENIPGNLFDWGKSLSCII